MADPSEDDGPAADADVGGDGTGDAGGDAPDGAGAADVDVDAVLDRTGFDAARSVLTRRQAEVLALRERGLRQSDVAAVLGTSRANVASVEASARTNVEKARETVAFATALEAPVRVEVAAGTDLYDVPTRVYDACDEAGVKVKHTAPDLMKLVSDAAGDAVHGRQVREPILVGVTAEGAVRVRRSGGVVVDASDGGDGAGP